MKSLSCIECSFPFVFDLQLHAGNPTSSCGSTLLLPGLSTIKALSLHSNGSSGRSVSRGRALFVTELSESCNPCQLVCRLSAYVQTSSRGAHCATGLIHHVPNPWYRFCHCSSASPILPLRLPLHIRLARDDLVHLGGTCRVDSVMGSL